MHAEIREHTATSGFLVYASMAPARYKPMPTTRMTQSGYGKRLPQPYEVRYLNRWRRVYAICNSNAASLYINDGGAKGGKVFLELYEI